MSNAQVPSWVMLFDDTGYSDRHVTRLYGQNIPDMHDIKSDDGKNGFNDKASSAMYCIEVGKVCRLYDDTNYKDNYRDLIGTGQLEKVSLKAQGFNDKTSSLLWLETS